MVLLEVFQSGFSVKTRRSADACESLLLYDSEMRRSLECFLSFELESVASFVAVDLAVVGTVREEVFAIVDAGLPPSFLEEFAFSG